MILTREEERILEGEEGDIKAKALRLLVEVGKQKGAERLVPIKRSHISGVSYKTAGKPMLHLLQDMAKHNVKVTTFATINPAGMPRDGWKKIGIPKDFARYQKKIIKAYQQLGCTITLSCTPYSIHPPQVGETVAFAESSAVCFVNSVIGAKTNRHGSLDALAASITGKVPRMGLILEENRKPRVHIKLNFTPSSQTEFSLIGLYIGGKIEQEENPLFSFPTTPSKRDLKSLGGGLATSGAIALFHVLDVTPEARKLKKTKLQGLETFKITKKDLKAFVESKKAKSKWSHPDLIAIGCPHIALEKLEKIAQKLQGRKIKNGIKFWIFTSNGVIEKAETKSLEIIKDAGGQIITDTCPVVTPIEQLEIEKVVVDSAKAFSYIPRLSEGVNASLANLEEIIRNWTKED